MQKTVYYLTPSSFCRGVEKSLQELDQVIQKHPDDAIYCIHAIVHNPKVAQTYIDQGVQFVETIDEIKDSQAVVAFSAHGTDRFILQDAAQRFKAIYNLECPLVTKIYKEIDMYLEKGQTIFFYIGKDTHQETKNAVAYARTKSATVYVFQTLETMPQIDMQTSFAVLSQTTLNFTHVKDLCDEIKKQYPHAHFPWLTDVCKATYDRQTVVIQNKDDFDTYIVIGGKESHNTRELVELGHTYGKHTLYAEGREDIIAMGEDVLLRDENVAITGGASTPEEDMRKIFAWYKERWYEGKIRNLVNVKGEYN